MALVSITTDAGALLSPSPPTANSYVSEAFANDWLTQIGRATGGADYAPISALTLPALLVLATEYVDRRFGKDFIGEPLAGTQPLSWPRRGAADKYDNTIGEDVIPVDILRAVVEYAVEIDKNDGNLLTVRDGNYDSFGTLRSKTTRVKIGSLEQYDQEVLDTYQTPHHLDIQENPDLLWPKYPTIDAMIEQYTNSSYSRTGVFFSPGETPIYLSDRFLGISDED